MVNLGDGAPGLKVERGGAASGIKLENIERISLTDKKGGDARDPLANLAKEANRARRNAQANGIVLSAGAAGASTLSFGIVDADGVALEQTRSAKLLQEIKALLARGHLREALGKVVELLRASPRHTEGLFLRAVCHYGLAEPRDGLRALTELREAKAAGGEVTPLLDSEATELRSKLRAAIVPIALQQNHERIVEGNAAGALADADELIQLDGSVWEFHFLRSDCLVALDKLPEALASAAAALAAAAPKQPAAVIELQNTLRGRLAAERLTETALPYYKKPDYRRARAAIAQLEPELRAAPITTLFDAYLERLAATSGGSPAKVPPQGDLATTDRLHFFLVGTDLVLAKMAMAAGKHEAARAVLVEALPFAPHFPYLRFALALATYEALAARFNSDTKPGLDEAERSVEEAREHVVIAKTDPELPQANQLLGILERLTSEIGEARKEEKKWDRDMPHLTALANAYGEIMRRAKGFESAANVPPLVRALRELQQKCKSSSGNLVSRQGPEILTRLEAAIRDRLAELAELESVLEIGDRLKALVERVKHGALYPTMARGDLEKLNIAITTLRSRLTTEVGKRAAADMSGVITSILLQLR